MNCMDSSPSFQEILEKKLETGLFPKGETQVETSISGADPLHLAYLMGLHSPKGIQSFKKNPKGNPYFSRQTQRVKRAKPLLAEPISPAKSSISPRKPGKPHVLCPLQKTSFDYFNTQQSGLLPDYTTSELKKAYRLLAQKFHPDKGGSVENFLALKNHFEYLNKVFI